MTDKMTKTTSPTHQSGFIVYRGHAEARQDFRHNLPAGMTMEGDTLIIPEGLEIKHVVTAEVNKKPLQFVTVKDVNGNSHSVSVVVDAPERLSIQTADGTIQKFSVLAEASEQKLRHARVHYVNHTIVERDMMDYTQRALAHGHHLATRDYAKSQNPQYQGDTLADRMKQNQLLDASGIPRFSGDGDRYGNSIEAYQAAQAEANAKREQKEKYQAQAARIKAEVAQKIAANKAQQAAYAPEPVASRSQPQAQATPAISGDVLKQAVAALDADRNGIVSNYEARNATSHARKSVIARLQDTHRDGVLDGIDFNLNPAINSDVTLVKSLINITNAAYSEGEVRPVTLPAPVRAKSTMTP